MTTKINDIRDDQVEFGSDDILMVFVGGPRLSDSNNRECVYDVSIGVGDGEPHTYTLTTYIDKDMKTSGLKIHTFEKGQSYKENYRRDLKVENTDIIIKFDTEEQVCEFLKDICRVETPKFVFPINPLTDKL